MLNVNLCSYCPNPFFSAQFSDTAPRQSNPTSYPARPGNPGRHGNYVFLSDNIFCWKQFSISPHWPHQTKIKPKLFYTSMLEFSGTKPLKGWTSAFSLKCGHVLTGFKMKMHILKYPDQTKTEKFGSEPNQKSPQLPGVCGRRENTK